MNRGFLESPMCKIVQNRTRSNARIRTKSAPNVLAMFDEDTMTKRGDWEFRLAVNTALAHVFRSGEILGLYTKYLAGVGMGVSNWAGVVFMFGGLPE